MYTLEKISKIKSKILDNPPRFLSLGFFIIIIIGALLLTLPVTTVNGEGTTIIDAFFTSTSAVCVTGLATINLSEHWNTLGHFIIMILIQIGGLGFVTMTTIVALLLGKNITLKNRLVIQEQMNSISMAGLVKLIKYVITSTLLIEFTGAVLMSFKFIPIYGFIKGLWYSVFHSVSAFCNAGFDIIGHDSLVDFSSDYYILSVISFLIIIGGLGFNVYIDIRNNGFNLKKIKLHTKIVLITTAALLAFGTLMIFVLEYYNNNTIGDMSFLGKIFNAFFQSVTTRTAGYASVNQNNLKDASIFISIILMFIGGSPASTAGGIKTTTFAIIIMTTIAELKAEKDIDVFNKRISNGIILRAISILVLGLFWVIFVVMALLITEKQGFYDLIFESVSAFATVGLSKGITNDLTIYGKIFIMLNMFVGRIGSITLAFAFARRKKSKNYRNTIGNIMVG